MEGLEPRLALDSTVVFNELMYHPADDGTPEWIELHNQMAVDMDVSRWHLSGGVNFEIPAGTIIPRQGYLVISANPAALAAQGFAGALGPWVGSLDNDGERVDLINNSDRLMNRVEYGDDGGWPVGADGTGSTLAKVNKDSASDPAENWATSAATDGTPGAENFPPYTPTVRDEMEIAIEGSWRYHDGGVDLGTAWKETSFDDASWASGPALFYDETAALPAAKNTPLTPGRITYYFRNTFQFGGNPAVTQLRLRPVIDDGAVYYLNGVEIYRQNMAAGPVDYNTLSTGVVGNASFAGPLTIPAASLVVGENVIAVEVHQGPMGGSNYSQTVLAADPVTYWRLNETSTTAGAVTDAANSAGVPQAGPQNGTFTAFNPSNLGQPGPRPSDTIGGQAMIGFESDNAAPDFQGNGDGGNDVALFPGAGPLDFGSTRRFSIEAWVKADPGAVHDSGGAVIAKGTGGGGEQFAIDVVGNQYRYFVWNGAPFPNNTPTVLQSSVSPNGSWQHLVATFDQSASVMRLYVNGQQVGSATPPATLVNTTHEVSIGARKNQNSSAYDLNLDGLIDEVAIYNRALSAAEVLAHYQAAFASGGGTGPDFEDVVFGLELVTRETLPDPTTVLVALNEIAAVTEASFWVELVNQGDQPASLDGFVLASMGVVDGEHVLSGVTIGPGQRHVLTQAAFGFHPADGDRLVLYSPGKSAVMDAIDVRARLRGRSPEGTGQWRFPSAATPGAANVFDFSDDIVINEVMYHARPHFPTPAVPATYQTTQLLGIDATTQWIFNETGTDLGTNWYQTEYDLTSPGWEQGASLIGYTPVSPYPLVEPLRTQVVRPVPFPSPTNPFIRTYYFQTTFNIADLDSFDTILVRHMIDDGAVFYLNGAEVGSLRFNMPGVPGQPVAYSVIATPGVGNAAYAGPFTVDKSLLRVGENVLSVEVHQSGTTTSNDVIFGLELSAATELTPPIPATPYSEEPEEWIELYNRGASAVDLGGWQLKEAVDFDFPAGTVLAPGEYLIVAGDVAAFQAARPGVPVVGPFQGALSNGNDRILLDDAFGNPADEVHYFDGGRWPEFADASGASLELRDPDADNSQGGAWAASDEGARSEWRTYTYRGIAETRSGTPTLWQEFAFGLLDGAGEVLIDDVSVKENPATTAIERIQNGSFNAGAQTWRMLGNHQRSQVIAEPGNPGNMVLRLVANGATEYQGNQIETTFGGGATIVNGREYEITFRAKWIAGSAQINSRLYFDRLAKTTVLDLPSSGGTPGAANSRLVANAGPTYQGLAHDPAVPQPGSPVTVSVMADDPDGVASMTLRYSLAGGAFVSAPMTHQGGGRYSGIIPGQAAAVLAQFYVEGQDALGATSQFPAGGPASRALVRWNDGQASTGLAHNFRILMTQADTDLLHFGPNTTSNERLGATIIYDEREIFYDAGVRLKGSFVGRDVPRVGFNVSFNPDQLFRGVHDKVAVDRSQTTTAIRPAEVILFHVGNQAGELPSRYDDIIHVIAPRSAQTSVAHLRMAGYDELFLDEQYENGSDGSSYEFEVIRWATTTVDGNPQSVKNSAQSGNGYDNVDFQNLGEDKEDYRWLFLLGNNRTQDDYSRLIPAVKTFSLTGAALDAAVEQTLDVDQWMRVFALSSLGGVRDAYHVVGADNHHNLRVYVRPDDGKLLALPWDWDNLFNSPTGPLFSPTANNLARIVNRPQNLRAYYGHLQDMIARSFNASYMSYWTTHYGQVAGQNFSDVLSYITQRANHVTSQLPAQVPFVITTNGGNDFAVTTPTATIEGNGWINVREIRLGGPAGPGSPLDVRWLDIDSWQVTVPLTQGANPLVFEALNFQGQVVATDTITVTTTATTPNLVTDLRITELMYHPADPTMAESAAGVVDADQLEFIELMNIGSQPLDLAGARFVDGIEFEFAPGGPALAPGGRALLVSDSEAFAKRYGEGIVVAGQYTGQLNNAGDHVRLENGAGTTILDFTYSDEAPWHPTTDGDGFSLVIIDPTGETAQWSTAAGWRPSFQVNGSPGMSDPLIGDINGDHRVDAADLAILQAHIGIATGALPADGDLDGDGAVNRNDAAIMARHFGLVTPPVAPSPEPVAHPAMAVAAESDAGQPRRPALSIATRRGPATDQALAEITEHISQRPVLRAARGSRRLPIDPIEKSI
jgi:hypothetical protein